MRKLLGPLWLALLVIVLGCQPQSDSPQKPAAGTNSNQAATKALPTNGPPDRPLEKLDSKSQETVVWAEKSLRESKMPLEGLALLKAVVEKYPDCNRAINAYGEALTMWGDSDAIANLFLSLPPTRDRALIAARALSRSRRFAEAVAVLKSILSATPDDADIQSFLAYSYFHNGDLPQAAEVIDKYLDKMSETEWVDSQAIRGQIWLHEGQADKAYECLKAALGKNPEHIQALTAMVRTRHAQGEKRSAEFYEQAAQKVRNKKSIDHQTEVRANIIRHEIRDMMKKKNYPEAKRLINLLMPDADEKTKAELQQLLKEIDMTLD